MADAEYLDPQQQWESRQQRAVFTRAALEEANRDRVAMGPITESPMVNAIELAFVESAHAQSTAAQLSGETDEAEALHEEARAELRRVTEGDEDILTGFGPSPGGFMKWALRFMGVGYILDKLGLPTPVMDMLQWAGETLGLENLALQLPFIGDPRVAVYYGNRLMGIMELGSWAEFRASMARAIWSNFRVRLEGG